MSTTSLTLANRYGTYQVGLSSVTDFDDTDPSDLALPELIEKLVIPVLRAAGYADGSIEALISTHGG